MYVFYGNSRKGLPDRWCLGFNHPNSDQLIEMLTIQNRFVVADKAPKSWVTADGQSYSVILLPGVLEAEPSKELEQRVNLCLQAIQTVTFRKLNPITLLQPAAVLYSACKQYNFPVGLRILQLKGSCSRLGLFIFGQNKKASHTHKPLNSMPSNLPVFRILSS